MLSGHRHPSLSRSFPVLFGRSAGKRFEVYAGEIDQGGYLSAEAHGEGTEEFITVFAGELTIRVNNEEHTIKNGESIRFRADRHHVYHNSGASLARMSMVIYYPD